jgi:hypothetical protein
MSKFMGYLITISFLTLLQSVVLASDPEIPLIVIHDEVAGATFPLTSQESDVLEIQVPELEVAEKSGLYLKAIEAMRRTVVPKMDTLLLKMKVPAAIRELVMGKFHGDLDKASTVIKKSNTGGISFSGIALVGVGISELLMEALQSSPYAKWIPFQGRFGLIVGGGISILRIKKNGRNRMLIRFHANVEKVDRVITWMLEGFVGGSFSKISSEVGDDIKTFEKVILRATNMGLAGRLIIGESHFEHAISSGAMVTPIVSGTYVYESQVHQYRINLLPAEIIPWVRRFGKPLCRRAI